MAVTREEGGSNAIKGFLFQFDRTILEILDNRQQEIHVEKSEDIEREKYYIQVKNRESTKFYPSSIRRATIHLLDLFLEDEERKFCLYCHFKDKKPGAWRPSFDDIKAILGKSHSEYTKEKIEAFSSHLVVQFSDDYNSEFNTLIKRLKDSFSLTTKQLAIMYHAVIRSYLLDLAVKDLSERKTSYAKFKTLVKKVQLHVSMDGYQRILGADKYERLIRKQYFVHKRANIDNFERLFIIECDETINSVDVMRIVGVVSSKYFVKGKSPQPYILFKNLDADVMTKVKQGLVDKGFFFNDGTWFNGDKIRIDKLFSKKIDEAFGKVKFLPGEKLLGSTKILDHFDEIYEFYIRDSLAIRDYEGCHIEVPVCDSQQAIKILKG